MTGTLATINGEAFAVPGLTFTGTRRQRGDWTRLSLICRDARGAVEVWTYDQMPSMGGVEFHSPTPLYGDVEPDHTDCDIVPGVGRCWYDGSSLTYAQRLLPLIEAGDSTAVLRQMAAWHEQQFGGAS